jgi:hypothetical protein
MMWLIFQRFCCGELVVGHMLITITVHEHLISVERICFHLFCREHHRMMFFLFSAANT